MDIMFRTRPPASLPRCLSRIQLVLAVTATAVVVAGGGFLLDWAFFGNQRDLLYSDALAALVAAIWASIALSLYNKRQKLALAHLQTIADVNHHVRNALTSVLYSVELTRNEALIEMTRSAVERIDWTLREVLPGDQPARLQRNAVATEQRKAS
jgi:hypothetical protein